MEKEIKLRKKMIEAGQEIASDLMDAVVSHKMGTMGGHVVKPISEYKNSDLIQKYLDDEISSVEAIYIAMKREETCEGCVELKQDGCHLIDGHCQRMAKDFFKGKAK